MKEFFKFMFASCLGGVLLIVGMVAFFGTCGVLMGDDKKTVESESFLDIDLENPLPELTGNTESEGLFDEKMVGLQDYKRLLGNAKNDPKIKGVVLRSRFLAAGFSAASELRAALEDFKSSGKPIFAFSDYYSQGAYYVSSVANTVWVSPTGGVDFRGLAFDQPFMKEGLDRLGVKMQVFYAGKFKSATEPLRLTAASPENKEQIRVYMEGMYQQILNDIARTRKIDGNTLRQISNNGLCRSSQDAMNQRLVDSVGYLDQMIGQINRNLGKEGKNKIKLVNPKDYLKNFEKNMGSGKEKIAVVYAEGTIDDSDSKENGAIQGTRYAQIIRDLRRDKNVKAIVLRVNSGGGSVIGSDAIRRELELARAEGKPVITSMGNYAASGGYYIALASDSIFAQTNTLTGSIGVFSVVPSFQKMFKDKLGVAFDTVKTGKFSALLSTARDISAEEGAILQVQTDAIYEDFLNKVAQSRRKTRDQIHEIAQGRVWLGDAAVANGLVDRIGNLDDAIAAAAAKSGLKTYKISEYPYMTDPSQKFLDNFMGKKDKGNRIEAAAAAKVREEALRQELGAFYGHYRQLRQLEQMNGVQARWLFAAPLRW